MNNRHLIKKVALTAVLATVLGITTAHAADVYLQAEQFQKVIPYGSDATSRSIPVVNASFEDPDCSQPGCTVDPIRGNYIAGSIAGWTVSGGAGAFRPNASIIVPTDGAQVAWSNGGELSQIVAEDLAPNTTYTLTVDVGSRTDNDIDTYIIGLYANGVLLAEDNNSLSPGAGSWLTSTVSYTTGESVDAGQAIEIRLDGNGTQEEFDNVRLQATPVAISVTMWGYSECDSTFSTCGSPSSPGPQINVPVGDTALNVTLRNTLPEATSIMIAGQANAPLSDPASVRVNGRLTSFVDVVPAAVQPATASITVNNAGFEDDALADGTWITSVSGWTAISGSGGTFNPTAAHFPGEAAEGSNTHFSNGSTFSQTLADTLQEGSYTLQVDVGDRADLGFPAYQVQLGVDDGGNFVLLAEDNSLLAPSSGFLTSTVNYTANAGDSNIGLPLAIRLVGGGVQVNFDNVRLDAQTGAATISTATYSWPALKSGTYLYHSGSHVQLQVQMGLYGAVVQDATGCGAANCAYADSEASYTAQEVLIFSEIDPSLHDPMPKPANATVEGYRPQFFLINGEPFDASDPMPSFAQTDDILLRLINAGLDNRAIQLIGGHVEMLAQDGRRLPTTQSRTTVLLPAAKSIDVLFAPDQAGTYTLFDRRMRLTNGPAHGGGMLHQFEVQ